MSPYSVVVVDDLPDLRQVIRLILEHGGPFRVVGEGGDGDEAVALAAAHRPDLLLMDVEMPGGPTGWEALPAIRAVAPATRVVILSGSRSQRDPSAWAPLAAAVLEKGLPPKELNAALVEVLERAGPPSRGVSPASGADDARQDVATDVGRPRGAAVSSSTDLAAFAEVVGHDLAQPLQVAYGYLELLRSDHRDALDATAASWLDAAVDSLERMRVLVHGVLGFARSGLRTPDPVDVDLAAVLDDVVARLPLPATTGDWQLRRGALPVVRGDREHLTTVVSELLDNARRFGADGVVVEVSAEATPEGWTVTVADDGPGLPAALDERAFEPFERGPSSSPRGPGLGLAVCRTLVEAHGGRIWSERGAGSGAVIRFSLPSDRVRPSATPHLTSDG